MTLTFIVVYILFFLGNSLGLTKNPLLSIFILISNFLGGAFYLWTLNLPFFTFLFIIIYVGAIAVLFLFVVMVIKAKNLELTDSEMSDNASAQILLAIFLLLPICWPTFLTWGNDIGGEPVEYYDLFNLAYDNLETAILKEIDYLFDAQLLGYVLYNYYILYVLLGGLMLLVAVVGSIVLSLDNAKKDTKKQIVDKQLSRGENFLSFRK